MRGGKWPCFSPSLAVLFFLLIWLVNIWLVNFGLAGLVGSLINIIYLFIIYFLKSNLLASTIIGQVTTGSYWGYVVWDSIPGRSCQGEQAREPSANDWTLANFSRIWWSLGIVARWMWLMQQMNPIPKINGVYHKMLGGWATTEPANGQDQPVQSVNYCNHL